MICSLFLNGCIDGDLATRLDEVSDHLIKIFAILSRERWMAGQHDPVFHDLVAGAKSIWMHTEFMIPEHGVARDIARENDAAHDSRILELPLELTSTPPRFGPDLQGITEPRGFGFGNDRRQDEFVGVLAQELGVPIEPLFTQFPEAINFVHLAETEGGAALVRNKAIGVFFEDKEAIVRNSIKVF